MKNNFTVLPESVKIELKLAGSQKSLVEVRDSLKDVKSIIVSPEPINLDPECAYFFLEIKSSEKVDIHCAARLFQALSQE